MGGSVLERWLWIILGFSLHFEASVVRSVSLPDITDEKFIDDCVKTHNRARSSVKPPATNMLYMSWDEALAVTARAWARQCTFNHNIHLRNAHQMHPVFPSAGENLWTATYFNDAKDAIKSWIDETKYYDYGSKTCTDVCGHYTQVVWASSFKVGCAVHYCPNGAKDGYQYIFVCNYATAGNYIGERPYKTTGNPCSECEGECVEKLCRSKERDAQRSYSWAPAWDPGLASCGTSCVVVLVLRPLALIGTFIAVYGVQRFYPNMFCYE